MDWSGVFSAAGLDLTAFEEVQPQWLPVTYADDRRAWEGRIPELPSDSVRVEAAAFNGRAASFVYLAWRPRARGQTLV